MAREAPTVVFLLWTGVVLVGLSIADYGSTLTFVIGILLWAGTGLYASIRELRLHPLVAVE